MLAATPLATISDTLDPATETVELNLTVANAAQPVVFAFQARPATGSTLNPAAVRIQNQAGTFLTPLLSQNSVNGAAESRTTIALANGTYEVHVASESNTTGNFEVRAFLAGDESGNQIVSDQEYTAASGSMLQSRFGWNHVAAMVYAKQGVDLSRTLYRAEYDVNASGQVDSFDLNAISMNRNRVAPTVTLATGQQAPTITAALSNDTGRSNTDGITNDLNATIGGMISDDGMIASFTATIDNGASTNLGTLLGQDFASGGSYSLNLARLEQIAGTGAGSLTNTGPHTLRLTATDTQGNSLTTPVAVTFSFDTVAPAVPTALDLAAASDTGSSSTDNITSDTTPTIGGTADTDALVRLSSSLVTGSIGEVIAAAGAFSITTSALAPGVHSITATATDIAGNVSAASTPLSITIDTTAPATPTLALAPEFDTGTVGDHLTTTATVTLQGVTEAGANVALRRGGNLLATGTAGIDGVFSFTSIALPFGAAQFEVTATDLAGAASTFTRTITRNNAPVVENQTFSLLEERPIGTNVGTVAATDVNTGEGDTLRYAITAGNTNNAFAINATTGSIQVANPAAVDFETTPTFTLTVSVTDNGGDGSGTAGTGLSDTATITINLTDANDAPNIVNQAFQLAENSPNATVVGMVQASDQNAGDSFTYAITAGNTDGAFAINANTGVLTVANAAALNFEAAASFPLTVTVTDTGNLSRSATVTVNLQNVNETPTVSDQSFFVPLNSSAGQSVGTIAVTDPDAGSSFTFEVLTSNAPAGVIAVNSTTGAITVANPAGLVAQAVYTLTVRVTDLAGAGLSDEATITLNVSANTAPATAGDVFQVVQDSSDNVLVVLANDSDPDAGDTLVVASVGATQAGGSAVVSGDGQTVRYTPQPGFLGVDHFTYTASDGHGGMVQNLVAVQVIKPVPSLDAHIDASLSIFILGERQPNPPAEIGVQLPNTLISPIHTEAMDGRLHIEPPTGGTTTQSVTIGDFFNTWRNNAGSAGNNPNAVFTAGQVLDHDVMPNEVVRMYVNGMPVPELGSYVIRDEDQIVIAVEPRSTAANAPSFVPIADQVVRAGSPLHIPLEGFDPNSQSLTFTATSSNTSVVSTFIASGNRSLQMTVEDYGQMVFELFEDRVPGITQNIVSLVQSGILDETSIHRIIEGFVFQGLDPTGTGFGHPGLLDFDDQYHPDLQHNSSGLLSMAKSGDDTNSSQVFITDVNPAALPTSVTLLRRLDFNHSIFGRLTAGENVRRLVVQLPTDNNDRPTTPVVVGDVEIVQVGDKAVLMLKALEGVTGQADVTVTATDGQGNQFSHTFQVTVQADNFNAPPFFTSTPTNVQTTVDTPVNLQLQAFDVEGNPMTISAEQVGLQAAILFDNSGGETNITTPGATSFAYLGTNWSGGTVTTTGMSPLAASGSSAYVFGAGGGQITFDVPISLASFHFVHQIGQSPFTATAFDASNNVVGTATSNLADDYNDPDNFEAFFASQASSHITRITFTGGNVDNFEFRARAIQATFQIDQATDIVTVTPPSGFVGTFAVLVKVNQTSPVADTVDVFDTQAIRITVVPQGTSSALAPPEGGDDGEYDDVALDAVFEALGAL